MATDKRRGRPPHGDILTPAEWRTVHAAQHGLSNREIATRSGVSVDAVKYHISNARAKLGVESKEALKDWFEAPNDSALGLQEKTMNEANKSCDIGAIGQISRSVSNIEAAQEWYDKVLGLHHLYTFDKIAFFECGGTRLFLNQQDEVSATESILYFRVPDIETACNTLQARGVAFTNAPHMIHKHEDGTEEWMAFFTDPDDRPLALMSQVKA